MLIYLKLISPASFRSRKPIIASTSMAFNVSPLVLTASLNLSYVSTIDPSLNSFFFVIIVVVFNSIIALDLRSSLTMSSEAKNS